MENNTQTKEMLILMIEACISFRKIDRIIGMLDGNAGLDYYKFISMWNMQDYLFEKSNLSDSENMDEFFRIIDDENIETEEKYKKLYT